MSAKQGLSRNVPNRPPTRRASRFRPTLTRLEHRAAPAIATWDGGGGNNNWTTAANWVGDVAPVPGDDLVFPDGTQQVVNANDFAVGTAFGTINVTGDGYSLSGNAVTLAVLTTNATFGNTQIGFGIVMAGAPLTIVVGSHSVLLYGPLTGTGGLVKGGTGTLVLSGANTYAGPTGISSGVLQVDTNTALGASGTGNETGVADGATLALNGNNLVIAEPLFFTGQGVIGLNSNAGAISMMDVGPVTLSGPLAITDNARVGQFSSFSDKLTVTGTVRELGGSHDLIFDLTGPGLALTETADIALTGRTTFAGDVLFRGRCTGPVTVEDDLTGSGTLGPVRTTFGGMLTPDLGGLTVGDIDLTDGGQLTPTFSAQGYGHFVVHGTIRVGRGLLVFTANDLQIRPGNVFTLFNNDGNDPVIGTFNGLPEGAIVATDASNSPVPLRISYQGGDGNDITLTGISQTAWAAGAGEGGEPIVNVYDGGGNLLRSFFAYPREFRGGVHVATADVTGDSVPDVVTGAGPGGGPLVRVWDGVTGAMVREFYAYDSNFTGGVYVASTNTIPDYNHLIRPHADIVTGAGPGGGPHVKVFRGVDGSLMSSFFAYDADFRGGVTVAATPTIQQSKVLLPGTVITGAGPGGGPHVRIFGSATGSLQSEFFAYDAAFRGGVQVGSDKSNIVTGPGSGSQPAVQVFNSSGQLQSSFFAYDASFAGGVNVAVLPLGPNGANRILTGAGPGGGPHVRQWEFPGPTSTQDLFAFDPAFIGGVFVG